LQLTTNADYNNAWDDERKLSQLMDEHWDRADDAKKVEAENQACQKRKRMEHPRPKQKRAKTTDSGKGDDVMERLRRMKGLQF
jgi:hypothetical protein